MIRVWGCGTLVWMLSKQVKRLQEPRGEPWQLGKRIELGSNFGNGSSDDKLVCNGVNKFVESKDIEPHLPNANKKTEIIRLPKIAINLHLGISNGAVKPEWPFGGVWPPVPWTLDWSSGVLATADEGMVALAVGNGSSSTLNLFSRSPSTLIVVVGDTIAECSESAIENRFSSGKMVMKDKLEPWMLLYTVEVFLPWLGQSPRLIFFESWPKPEALSMTTLLVLIML